MNPSRAKYHVVRPLGPDARLAVVRVSAARPDYYLVRPIPSQLGGTGYAVLKLGGTAVRHVLLVGHRAGTCDCIQSLRRGFCRHVMAASAVHEG